MLLHTFGHFIDHLAKCKYTPSTYLFGSDVQVYPRTFLTMFFSCCKHREYGNEIFDKFESDNLLP